jgi:hypothetical protein
MGHAATKPDKVSIWNKTARKLKKNFKSYHIHSSRMKSRGTNPGVATKESSFTRLYLV